MRIAQVVLDIPTQSLDTPYTYAVPDVGLSGDYPCEVGCAVVVPFGHRKAVGFVVDLAEYDEANLPCDIDPKKLKFIEAVVSESYFDEEAAACAQFLSERYVAPLSACVRLFTPPGGVPRMVRTRAGSWRLERPTTGEVDDRWVKLGSAAATFTPRANAIKQRAIIDALRAGELRAAELSLEFGSVAQTLKTLEKKGVVVVERRRRLRGVPAAARRQAGGASAADQLRQRVGAAAVALRSADGAGAAHGRNAGGTGAAQERHAADDEAARRNAPVFPADVSCAAVFVPSVKPKLTPGQERALEAIAAASDRADGSVVLVDGVTGSGKTEVYLQAIERVLDQGRCACVLVPEISLTPQTVARFRGRFGDLVAVMHSRMSAGERFDQWDFIRSGAARVVVGARSALFTPLSNVGLYIIDEEHEGSYKQDSAPRYQARDVACWMAKRAGAAVVLGSATPSIESLYQVRNNPAWTCAQLPERANGKPLPEVTVVDMAREFGSGSRSMFSRTLQTALERELAAGRKAVLLLNQRGFAKFVLCRDCGFVPECPSCSTSLTYHERGGMLICHHCGYRTPLPARCPKCGSPYLKKFGAGTQRVEADLRVLIDSFSDVDSGIPLIRMDADTTQGKGAHERLLEQFAQPGPAVLLGTQMIAKGLDFDDVTLVGVINADTQLHLPDYRAGERTFDLIEQVAGRAGRADLPGRVLVQTYEADSVPIRAAAAYDRALFLNDELPKRRALGYPPYVRLANILVWGPDERAVAAEAEKLRAKAVERVRDYGGDGWRVLAASPCVLAKLRKTYRYHVLVKCPLDAEPGAVLGPLFRARRTLEQVNATVDIDPLSLL
ncbi:MAG: primosomal protein N' [Eggerthellaceae bacterium]|jgi:primosomal protein N' (replication factor Y)